jgi:hypothetical protein
MDYRSRFSKTGFPGKGIVGNNPDDQHKFGDKNVQVAKPPWDEKLQSLRNQRRARGECFKCGDKFQPSHKCSKIVPIHLVEELMEVLQLQSSYSEDADDSKTNSEESFMHISQCALSGTTSKKSIRLQGTVNGKQVLILIDSGSCESFVSNTAVEQLGLKTEKGEAVMVQVADGGKSKITDVVPALQWVCQGSTFTTPVRVFNIPCYDIILGMDWLDRCGKMWVDWPKKSMRFRHNGVRITLKGIKNKVTSCKPISSSELQKLIKK